MWSYTTGGGVASSPAVAGGIVYAGSYDGKVYALDASAATSYGVTRLVIWWFLHLLLPTA